jgi:hypothetical protein
MIDLDVNKKVFEFKQKKCDKDRGKLSNKDFIKNKYEKKKYFCSLPNLKDEESMLNLCYDAIIDNDFYSIYPYIGLQMVNINKVSDKQSS